MTLFQLLVVNDWNIISANFVEVHRMKCAGFAPKHPVALAFTTHSPPKQITGTGWSYVFFMLYHVMVTMVGLSCVTSFFISHLSARLEEELEVRACVFVGPFEQNRTLSMYLPTLSIIHDGCTHRSTNAWSASFVSAASKATNAAVAAPTGAPNGRGPGHGGLARSPTLATWVRQGCPPCRRRSAGTIRPRPRRSGTGWSDGSVRASWSWPR